MPRREEWPEGDIADERCGSKPVAAEPHVTPQPMLALGAREEGDDSDGNRHHEGDDHHLSCHQGVLQPPSVRTFTKFVSWSPVTSVRKAATSSWKIRATMNLTVTEPSLMRGLPWAKLLRGSGKVLSDNTSNPEYYEESVPVPRLNTFLSHTWRTPRWKKFLVLILHFNLVPSLLVTSLVTIAISILTATGFLPAATAKDFLGDGSSFTRGVLCMPIGLCTFVLCLFFIHELDRFGFPLGRHAVFLDKTCVNQHDLDLKKKGIQSLAAFLNHSEDMLVMYSPAYMQRLWTVYEVATWLILHQGARVIARPMFGPVLVLCGLFTFATFEPLWLLLSFVISEPLPQVFGFLFFLVLLLPCFSATAVMAGKWATEHAKLDSYVTNFKLADAKCYDEEDRVVVRANIIDFMRLAKLSTPDDDDATVCSAFEDLVRREVPKLMWASFGRLGVPYIWSLLFGFAHLLVGFDLAAGYVLDSQSARYIILWTMLYIAKVAGVAPLIAAFIFSSARYRIARNVAGYTFIGLLATCILLGFQVVCAVLTTNAVTSDRWLAILLAFHALLLAGNCAVYPPISLARKIDLKASLRPAGLRRSVTRVLSKLSFDPAH